MKRFAALLLVICLPTCLGCWSSYQPPKGSIPDVPAAQPRVLPSADGTAVTPTAPAN